MTRVIVTILIAVALPSCRRHEATAEFWRNEREKTELIHRLELSEYRMSLPNARSGQELDDIRKQISEMEVRLQNLQSNRRALISDIAVMTDRNMEASKTGLARLREKCQGTSFDTLTAKNGRIYQNVRVVEVDDSGVLIRHENGAARLGYADLSNEQRLFFGIEESSALAAEERERKEALLYEQSIDMQMAAIKANEKASSARDAADDELRAMRARIAAASRPREPSLLSQPARPFGTGSIYRRSPGYSYYGYYRPAYRFVQVVPSSPNPFCSSYTSQTFRSNNVTRSPYLPIRPCPAPIREGPTLQTPTTP